MPRRTRKRCVGKWEQIEREAREDELKELERELHRERQRSGKPKPKAKQRKPVPPPEQEEKPGNERTGSHG